MFNLINQTNKILLKVSINGLIHKYLSYCIVSIGQTTHQISFKKNLACGAGFSWKKSCLRRINYCLRCTKIFPAA